MSTYYHLYEVEYMSHEGNYRTSHAVLASSNAIEESVETAMSTYYANSDSFGDSPSQMVGATYITTLLSPEEMAALCGSTGIYAETYDV